MAECGDLAAGRTTDLIKWTPKGPNSEVFCILYESSLIGHLVVDELRHMDAMSLYSIFIYTEFQGNGHGTAAMKCLEAIVSDRALGQLFLVPHEVANTPIEALRKWYYGMGFSDSGNERGRMEKRIRKSL